MNRSNDAVSLKNFGVQKVFDSPYGEGIFDKLSIKNSYEVFLVSVFLVNISTFLVVALCNFGLGIVSACVYISIAYSLIGLNAGLQIYVYKTKSAKRNVSLFTELVEDSAIAVLLFVNLFSQQAADPIIALGLVISALFIQSAVSVKPFSGFMLSKTCMFIGSVAYVLFYESEFLSAATIIFPLTVAFLLLLSVGYWLYIRQVQVFHLTLSQNHMNEILVARSEELDNAHRLREKIVRHIGHDLRQPINSLNYAVFNIKSRTLDANQRGQIELAIRSIESANYLVEEILQISTYKKEREISVDIEIIDVGMILESLYGEYLSVAQQSGCKIKFVNCSLTIRSDPQIISRILRNFLSNAVRYAKESKILIGARRKLHFIELQVLDGGPGMTKALLESACDEFTQGEQSIEQGGFGLGLNIAKNLAGTIDGEVNIKSTLGRGTMCSLTIPVEKIPVNTAI